MTSLPGFAAVATGPMSSGWGGEGGEVLVLPPDRGPAAAGNPRGLRHLAAFVDEAVHALAPADEVLGRPRVARDHDAPAAALEAVAEGGLDGVVVDAEGAHRHAAGLEDLALLDLRHRHARALALDHVGAADLDVPAAEVGEPVHLSLRPGRPPHLEGRVLP